jgi:hypothetical protein
MKTGLRRRFWVEAISALVNGALCLMTALQSTWIERVFRVDPDNSGGSLEWLVVLVSLGVTLALVNASHNEWRRRTTVTV